MTARILIVDDVPANTRLLEAKLSAEYYQVANARDGFQAIELATEWQPDLILLDIMMPGMDGYECCRRLKGAAATTHIPVVMVTALGEPSERLRGLEAGADDFLTKPVEYDTLIARVRSLVRLKRLLDECRHRAETARALGLADETADTLEVSGARALIVDDWELEARTLTQALSRDGVHSVHAATGADARRHAADLSYDLIIISMAIANEDPLQLVAQLRASDSTHDTPILLVSEPQGNERTLRGFALGASDCITVPIDDNELRARARNQVRRKLYQDRLRADLGTALELALTNSLTGLYNQRYLRRHLTGLLRARSAQEIAVLMIDIDHFKSVNDRFGHPVGDEALRLVAQMLRANTRVFNSVARYGGEEFVVIMPGTGIEDAMAAGERLREAAIMLNFASNGERVPLTVSIGVATSQATGNDIEALLKAADDALYAAKTGGRNQVRSAVTAP